MFLAKPPPLAANSHVRVLSPSGPVTESLMQHSLETLESWGLSVSTDVSAFARDRYLAGSDQQRALALQNALLDDDVDMVLCSRGGYGAMRILDAVDWSHLARRPKILAGFSDITALHFAANRAGVATLHGHVAKSFGSQAEDLENFRRVIFGEIDPLEVEVTAVCDGRARGPLFGGNLSLVAALAGSRHLPNLDGAILFIEDVTEEDYRLDRLFTSLRLNPAFNGLAGVILGGFDKCAGTYVSEEEMPEFLAGLARELGAQWQVPVVMDFPSGHGSRNVALPFGCAVTLDADRGTVLLDDSFTR